ncbi:T9SS type A sorting domain-containing protein [Xylanibacter brevis]|uniref:T9SS type A sorting domain-containing protein n=1 Tax=Xylanibacter brevis TaxID=83231 RepID=UPI000488DF2D|nr:T9SS type A sorting domain-containing protein [Xylanibacter brevis]
MYRKIVLSLSVAFMTCPSLNAQNEVRFAYDEAGNRVKRELVIARSRSPKRSFSKENVYYDELGGETVRISSNNTGAIIITVLRMLSADEGNVEVYTLSGEKVLSCSLSSETVVDLSDRSHGIYILKVTLNGIVTTWKITKK